MDWSRLVSWSWRRFWHIQWARRFDESRLNEVIIDIKHTLKLGEHQGKYTSGDLKSWAEDYSYVTHRHLILAGVLHDKNQMRNDGSKKAVIREWEHGNESL